MKQLKINPLMAVAAKTRRLIGEAVLVGVCYVITFVFDNQLMKQGKLRCLN